MSEKTFTDNDEERRLLQLKSEVVAEFRKGMELYQDGHQCPQSDGLKEITPKMMGWLAAEEMNVVKKRWLLSCKNKFVV
jgi:hypothetical protein